MTTGLPETGRKPSEILAQLKALAAGDPDFRGHRMWSLVYYLDREHEQFLARAYQAFSSANGLSPGAFKSLKQMESDIVAVVAELFHGPQGTCGVLTSGGTESCLLAVKTYRDMAATQRRIRKPEMVLPVTAHVAWFKASEYFGVKTRLLPLDAQLRTDAGKLERLVNRNTVLVVGSAPEYPHGTIDPISAMGAVAQRHGIPLHVDACVGGFILPFMEMNGRNLPVWDYRVPGVTSISADLHKYGFAAKGASTITYRHLDYLKHQMFLNQDWPGGVFASAALLGTRPGGAYAAAWGALQYFGRSGYRELAEHTGVAVDRLCAGIEAIPGLKLLAAPQGPLLAYGSIDPRVNIYAVGDQMDARGWSINRVQRPDGLHAMVTARHLAVVPDYLADLRAAVDTVRAHPELARQGSAATYGMLAHVPLRGMVRRRVLDLFAGMYAPGGGALDLGAARLDADGAPAVRPHKQALLERALARYVQWKSRRG